MPANKFLLTGNVIKKKNLPFFETETLNFYIRTKRNPNFIREYYQESNILKPVLHAGSFWSTLKKGFKKGKNILNKTMDFIDSNPITSTLKDIGFDYLQQKTGFNPNDIYNTTRNIINMTPTDVKNTTNKLIQTTAKHIKNKHINKNNTSYKDLLNNYYEDLTKSIPKYQSQIKENFNLLSSGSEVATGLSSSQFETIKRNIPKMLLMARGPKGGLSINEMFKPYLVKYGIKTLTLPKTVKDFITKLANKSTGRLYQGRGEEVSTGNKIDRYNEILNKLKGKK